MKKYILLASAGLFGCFFLSGCETGVSVGEGYDYGPYYDDGWGWGPPYDGWGWNEGWGWGDDEGDDD